MIGKLVRYGAVSVVSTSISQCVLIVLLTLRWSSPATANVIATLAGIGPSFEMNRRWVWGRTGRRSLAAEVAPFVALSLTGLALSTVAVAAVTGYATASGWSSTVSTSAAVVANLGAFGDVWLVQFVVLDRVFFARPRDRAII